MSTYTVSKLAGVFGVTPKTVFGWISDGMPVASRGKQGRGATHKLDLEKCVRWYMDHRQGDVDLARERARLAAAQADARELANAELTGQLGRYSIWLRELERAIASTRNALLAIPAKLAPILETTVGIAAKRDVLDAGIRDALISLSGSGEQSQPSPPKRQRSSGRARAPRSLSSSHQEQFR